MARGRRGTVAARVARLPIDQLQVAPRWIEPDEKTASAVDGLEAEARRDLAYAYVSLTEAIAKLGEANPAQRAKLARSRNATRAALTALGVNVDTDTIIRECLA